MGKRRITTAGLVAMLFILVGAVAAEAMDRCVSYISDVREAHTRYFGPAFPYWYGVGQLRQESNCKDVTTAFDGGMGPAQFMPKTAREISSLMGEALDPYNRKDAVRMQAFYMARIHSRENWDGGLWISYQIYNGGRSTLLAESRRAGVTEWGPMRAVCARKKLQMKWGVLDLCEVNYDYSKRVGRYGNQYRRGPDQMRYW